jgi:hypothetical protein
MSSVSVTSCAHHVAIEIGDDPDRARDDEKNDQHTEGGCRASKHEARYG